MDWVGAKYLGSPSKLTFFYLPIAPLGLLHILRASLREIGVWE